MLSIVKVRRAGLGYYLASLPAEEGRTGLVEEDGTFLGRGARRLGIEGARVSQGVLDPVFAARHPASGETLSRRPPTEVVAFDCTFSTPKAVSLLEALSEPDLGARVRSAQRAAVASVLGYIERNAAAVRRVVSGERRPVAADGFIAAAFLHRTSRAPDPHLHTHLLVANLASDADGRYSALDARPLYAHLAVAGALYDAELRARLSESLGVAWRRTPGGALDLVGVPDHVARAFSRRRVDIENELRRVGRTSGPARRIAAQRTRPPKDRTAPIAALVDDWRERALLLGVASSRWHRVAPERGIERHGRERVATAVECSIRAMDWPFTAAALLAWTARSIDDGASVRDLETAVGEALGSGGRVVAFEGDSGARGAAPRFTTPEIEEVRSRLVDLWSRAEVIRASTVASLPSTGVIVLEDGGKDSQRARALATLVANAHRDGRPVRAVAVDVAAAARLGRQSGLVVGVDLALPPAKPGGVLVVGEPGRMRPSQLVSLAERSDAAGGVLVLVGDGAGGSPVGPALGHERRSLVRAQIVGGPGGRSVSA